jgi:hypothetical protein
MKSKWILLMLCALHMFAADQGRTTVGGPVAGFVFDQKTQAVRPMLGLPGAAYLGDAILGGLNAAAIAPDGSSALAVREGQLFLLTGLKSGEISAKAVENAIGGADRFAWSADSSAVAVYASASGRAQVIKAGAAGEPVDLSGLPGAVTALVLDGSGKLLAGVAGGIYLDGRLLASAAYPAALSVAGRDLFFVDQERDQVWQVLDYAGQPAAAVFAAGIAGPAGVQVYDGRVFVAGSKGLDVFDLASRALVAHIDLEFTPTQMASFGEKALWLLNAPTGDEPLYVLSAAGAPAVYFVPAGREQ